MQMKSNSYSVRKEHWPISRPRLIKDSWISIPGNQHRKKLKRPRKMIWEIRSMIHFNKCMDLTRKKPRNRQMKPNEDSNNAYPCYWSLCRNLTNYSNPWDEIRKIFFSPKTNGWISANKLIVIKLKIRAKSYYKGSARSKWDIIVTKP